MAVVQCMMHEAGRISRNRPAFIADDIRIHYGELDLMVSSTAALLRAAGIESGDRVAIYMESGWAYATLLFALMRVGAVACPMSTRLPLDPLKERLATVDCKYLVARVRDESRAALEEYVCLDPDGLVSRELSSGQSSDSFEIPLDQPATIVFTSGSEGRPKAVLHTYGNHYYSAYGANINVPLRSDSCWLLSLPLYHVGGLGILFRCVQSGAAVAIMKPDEPLADALARFPVTHLSLVPTQLQRLMRADLSDDVRRRLRAVLLGGAAVSPELVGAARRAGFPLVPTYGLSEMTSQVTACGPATPPDKSGTAGAVLRYREVRVDDAGEILVRGETLFKGYVEQTRVHLPVDAEGWFATGDTGAMDADGYLTVRGRKDNRFISGGENIQPEEIERALINIDGVRAAVVVPVSDDEFGERPVAFVERATDLTDSDLRDALRERLPKFMIPDAFLPWPETEESEGMKPDRNWLRKQVT